MTQLPVVDHLKSLCSRVGAPQYPIGIVEFDWRSKRTELGVYLVCTSLQQMYVQSHQKGNPEL